MNDSILRCTLALVFFVCACSDRVSSCIDTSCEEGEVCLAGECVTDVPLDAGDSGPRADAALDAVGDVSADVLLSPDARFPADGGAADSMVDGISRDAAPDSGPVGTCGPGEVLCGGACAAPTPPELGLHVPVRGTSRVDHFLSGDIAVDPCTGTIALAYAQQLGSSENWELFVSVMPTAGAATTPLRVTFAPGAASDVQVVWTGDRFGVIWSDARHDLAPETCSRCRREIYYAAVDVDGALFVPEVRLTVGGISDHVRARAAVHRASGEIAVAWVNTLTVPRAWVAIVHPDGMVRAMQEISEVTALRAYILWHDGAWQAFYAEDTSSGRLHVRRLETTGVVGPDLRLPLQPQSLGITARGSRGYATVASSVGVLSLWDLSWSRSTILPLTVRASGGSRALVWDGTSLYVTDQRSGFSIVRLNDLGVETGRIALEREERSELELRMLLVGERLVVKWVWGDGVNVEHRIQVVDTASAM